MALESDSENFKFYNLQKAGEGQYREKMSRFLAFAVPCRRSEEAKEIVKTYQNKFHDARHVCWAWTIGEDYSDWQLNDNGEPSGTAGKPILGQIRSFGVTDTLVIVVRYFGGIKLGTSGLISAYREAARLALENAGKKECSRMKKWDVEVGYVALDSVMRLVKDNDLEVLESHYDNLCRLTLNVPLQKEEEVMGKMAKTEGIFLQRRES